MFEAIQNLLDHPEQFDNLQESQSQAFDALNEFLEGDSQNKEALELKIKIALLLRKYTVAKQTAKTLLMLGGEESVFLDLYAQSLLLSGDFDGAESTYMRAYKLDPDSSFSFGQKYKHTKELNKLKKDGNEKVSKGKYEEAIQLYSNGVEKCKEWNIGCGYMFLNNRSACYMNMKRYDSALEDIDQSLIQYPYAPKSYLRKTKCIQSLNETSRFSEIPTNYLNALYSMAYRDASTKSVCKEYIQFLRNHKAFETNVKSINSKKELDRVLSINPNTLIVLDIYASWCGPCKKLAPILDELSVSHPSVIFLKIDGDKERSVASQYQLEGFPTIVFIRNNQVIDKVVGYDPDGIENTINTNICIQPDSLFG